MCALLLLLLLFFDLLFWCVSLCVCVLLLCFFMCVIVVVIFFWGGVGVGGGLHEVLDLALCLARINNDYNHFIHLSVLGRVICYFTISNCNSKKQQP